MNGEVINFQKKTVRERLDERDTFLREGLGAVVHNARIDRARIEAIEKHLGIVWPPEPVNVEDAKTNE